MVQKIAWIMRTAVWESARKLVSVPEVSREEPWLRRPLAASNCSLFCSAVRTVDSAATAAARCDPWVDRFGLEAATFSLEEGLNAEFKAANASALWVCPPGVESYALVLDCKTIWMV